MKDVKVVIGSNFGDEGKGLMTRWFTVDSILSNKKPIIIFHNGTAQRGHTVDYTRNFRHIYHHFGSGTIDSAPTYFTNTFWIHPMEFVREYNELAQLGYYPITYCDITAPVITPFDMLVDHVTEAWLGRLLGQREYGSCGYGSWCAIESRGYNNVYHIEDYLGATEILRRYLLEKTWCSCLDVLIARGVNVEELPQYKNYFTPNSPLKEKLIQHFLHDLDFFFKHTTFMNFHNIYSAFDTLIFENGQGLGLDKDVNNNWHTTSKTGLTNPYNFLKSEEDFSAEVCYVSRSYITRHGVGPLPEEVKKSEINSDMFDKTNVHNEFQGGLRYGYLEDKVREERINNDWAAVSQDKRFNKTIALTHCNEFFESFMKADYYSNNPFSITLQP